MIKVCTECNKGFQFKLSSHGDRCRDCCIKSKRAELRENCRVNHLCYDCNKPVEPKFPSRCKKCREKIHSKVNT
jgi:hypothetical protein